MGDKGTDKIQRFESATFYSLALFSVLMVYVSEELDYPRTFWDYYAIDFIIVAGMIFPFGLYALRNCPNKFGLYFSYLFIEVASVLPVILAWLPSQAFHNLISVHYPAPNSASCYLCSLPFWPNLHDAYNPTPLFFLFFGQSDPVGKGYEAHLFIVALPIIAYNIWLYVKSLRS